MEKQILIRKQLEQLLFNYEKLLDRLEKKWPAYPEGCLHIKRQDDQIFYARLLYDSKRTTELPISQELPDGRQLINELVEKRVCLHGRPILKKNIAALRSALRKLTIYDPGLLAGTAFNPAQEEESSLSLPDAFFLPGQLNVQKWIRDTKAGNFRINPYKPEQRRIPSADGHMTRSKSEEKWCDILAAESLLYRYDSGVRLSSGRTVYPDFIVLHPRERRLILIEHFGLMDDPGYAIDQLYKLEEYAQSGYLPGSDVFFTVETKDRPLTRDRIYEVLYRSGLLPRL